MSHAEAGSLERFTMMRQKICGSWKTNARFDQQTGKTEAVWGEKLGGC